MEAAFRAWVEELRADQAQFCADKVLMLGEKCLRDMLGYPGLISIWIKLVDMIKS